MGVKNAVLSLNYLYTLVDANVKLVAFDLGLP